MKQEPALKNCISSFNRRKKNFLNNHFESHCKRYKTSMVRMNYIHTAFIIISTLILFLIDSCHTCPLEIQPFCDCIDESDGVLLNCFKKIDANELMHTLREIQSQIGLLKFLSIQNSNIPVLSSNYFSGLYIKRLEISNCKIKITENNSFAGLETILQELNLSNNEMTEIPVAALSGLNSIVKLNLSNNLIGEIKVHDLLPRLPKLFDIDLSHNKISNTHKSFFENVKQSLQTINLGHNELTEVPASALRGFRQLMALHLHNNKLQHLSALAFMNLPVLSLLNLASNKIKTIHKQAFLNAPNLRFLYMTDNQLSHIEPYQFASFEQIEMIDLSNNQLEALDNDTFSNLISLKQLFLGENQINRIENFALANSSVTVLILESNQIKDVNKDMFQGATKLQQLSLKENKIKNVDSNAFQSNPALVMLDLSHNDIIDISPATFIMQINMLLVDLSYNKLLRIPYSALNRRVVTVLLKENPLVCIEKVHMLQQGVGVYVPNTKDLICNENKESESLRKINQQKQSQNETAVSDVNAQNKENENSFKQLPNTQADPNKTEVSKLHLHRLPNIKPLQRKKNTTTLINQFVDQSQQLGNFTTKSQLLPFIENVKKKELKNVSNDESQNLNAYTKTTKKVVDIANDPNVIYPLPVPFLTRPSKLHTAQRITQNSKQSINLNNNSIITQTLPPSIVLAPYQPIFTKTIMLAENNNDSVERLILTDSKMSKTPMLEEFEIQESRMKKTNTKSEDSALKKEKISLFDTRFEEGQENKMNLNRSLPTAIIMICLSTVAIVMCAVFMGMCVAKRRQIQLIENSSDSTVGINSSHTALKSQHSSYLTSSAAHAAQMNLIYSNGTLPRENGTMSRLPPLQDDIYGWTYSPSVYNIYPHK